MVCKFPQVCYTVAMKKSLSIGLAMIASILLIFVIAFTALQQVINNETFINNEFTKLGTADSMGMNNADLVSAMVVLVDYMEGNVDSLDLTVTVDGMKVEMFDLEQERTHMEDVRTIYQTVRGYRDISVLVLLVVFLLAALINFRRAPQSLAQGFLFGAFVMLVIFGFIGTWAAMDFSSFWTFFHEALFWNDLWLFDASESRMINMLPEQFFADIVGRFGLYAGVAVGALILLSVVALIMSSERYQARRADALVRRKQRVAYRKNRAALKEQKRKEVEAEKRAAEKKAAKAAARAKAAEQAEKEQLAAEKARQAAKDALEKAAAKQEKEERRRAAAKKASTKATAKPASSAAAPAARPAKSGATKKSVAKAPSKSGKAKKKNNIIDDTGFFDE